MGHDPLRGVEPGADRVSVLLDTVDGPRREPVGWLVGADGSHSVVRRAAGIAFEGDATGKVFANVDALLDCGPTPGVGHYFFTPLGMLVIAPLPDGVYRVTASIDPAEADRELTLADVQEFIDRRGLPGITVRSLRDSGWGIARIRIQTRIAGAFRSGRCLLAGDAAHIYGPTGAQGMNGGIQDAHNLAWKLALVVAGRAGDELLDTYEGERRAIAVGVLHHVEQQTKLATVRSAPVVAARDAFLRLATKAGLLTAGWRRRSTSSTWPTHCPDRRRAGCAGPVARSAAGSRTSPSTAAPACTNCSPADRSRCSRCARRPRRRPGSVSWPPPCGSRRTGTWSGCTRCTGPLPVAGCTRCWAPARRVRWRSSAPTSTSPR